MGALDADAAILDVLRAEADDLATPRCSLKRKFHNKPLLASRAANERDIV